jgi:hypothetical protein
MIKFTWGLTLGLCIAMIGSSYASRPPQTLKLELETMRGDLKHFRDFHDSLLVLCNRKLEDSMCIPLPRRKPR